MSARRIRQFLRRYSPKLFRCTRIGWHKNWRQMHCLRNFSLVHLLHSCLLSFFFPFVRVSSTRPKCELQFAQQTHSDSSPTLPSFVCEAHIGNIVLLATGRFAQTSPQTFICVQSDFECGCVCLTAVDFIRILMIFT